MTPHLIFSRYNKAEWETNQDYCDGVKERSPFDEGRVLLDLIDLHIFDFIQGMPSSRGIFSCGVLTCLILPGVWWDCVFSLNHTTPIPITYNDSHL